MPVDNKNTIRQILGFIETKGDVGIEIEAEASGDVGFPTAGLPTPWVATHDNSLRGISVEYVMGKPIPINKVVDSVESLRKKVVETGTQVKYTFRAGVHVHVNCQDMTPQQVLMFACLYYSLENVLVEWCGEDRVGNFFCLRVRDAEYVLPYVAEVLRKNDHFYALENNKIRYAALNWCALVKYGSLEFRAMATEKDFSKVAEWAQILHQLREVSKEFDSIQTLLERFSQETPEEWCQHLLGEHWPKFKGQKDIDKKVWEGVHYAQDFLFYTL